MDDYGQELSPDSGVAGEISQIESKPGFLLPDEKGQLLRDVNRPEYDRLSKVRDGLYDRRAQQNKDEGLGVDGKPLSPEPAKQSNVKPLQEQAELIQEADREMELLVGLNFERVSIPLDITQEQVTYLKMQRLAAQENYTELYPIMTERLDDLPVENQEMVSQFMAAENVDPTLRKEVTESILASMNRARKQQEKTNGLLC